MKTLFAYFAFVLIVSAAHSQTVIKATSQGWAGGVCCVTGVNYNVTVKISRKTENIAVKEVWLKGHGLIQHAQINPVKGKTGQFLIHFGASHNENDLWIDKNIEKKETDEHQKDKMPDFNGQCLIVLKSGARTYKITVDKFEVLPSIAYP